MHPVSEFIFGQAEASPRDRAEFDTTNHPSPVPADQRRQLRQDPGFGRVKTDHMVTIRYSAQQGWHAARLEPRADFTLDPTAMVFHQAQEIFEGMKAYRLADGGAALFRPTLNARRFANSARRMAMPPLPEALFVESVRRLVRLEEDWIPNADGAALYIRPFMLATEPILSVRPSAEYLFCVVATPVGSYFSDSTSALRLWVSDTYCRAAPGGTGEAKCGGNYAAGLAAQAEAIGQGCDQVVFLDAVERQWIEELGGMNLFFVFDDGTLLTPPLTGTILPGVTRDSLLILARQMGLSVREAPYSIDQWQADAQSGRLREAFACGTAAVVIPIGSVKGKRHNFTIGEEGEASLTVQLKSALVGIQRGIAPDANGWLDRVV
ncbi:branched-chain amino acid aminotransferase [Spirosoma aerophilum]